MPYRGSQYLDFKVLLTCKGHTLSLSSYHIASETYGELVTRVQDFSIKIDNASGSSHY